jgi:FkbM family methyltransferase
MRRRVAERRPLTTVARPYYDAGIVTRPGFSRGATAAIVVVLAAVAAALFWRAGASSSAPDGPALPPGARYLEKGYGPSRYSQFAEEWIIRDFFRDRRNGVFVDVGANHYRDSSTTFYLEEHLGWSGLAVEPLAQFEADYRTHRPRTTFLPFFVSDASDERAKLYVLDQHTVVSSFDRSFTERTGKNPREMDVPTITMNDLLHRNGIERFDFLSMDIELAEPKALAGFDIRRYRPALVCIEAHSEVRQQILDYFARNGYVIVGKYLAADEHNLYFMPLEP